MTSPATHPVLTCAAAAAWEAGVLADDHAAWAAMLAAGNALGDALADLLPATPARGNPRPRILVLAGRGHNGGDACLAAARLLRHLPGAEVHAALVLGRATLRPLARRALEALGDAAGAALRVTEGVPASEDATRADVWLDGVFGLSFRPPLPPEVAALFRRLDALEPGPALRVAVDLPSGLHDGGDAGAPRADVTLATGILKRPAADAAHAGVVGRLRYLDLGFFRAGAPESVQHVLAPEEPGAALRLRPAVSDKRTFGHAAILAGARAMPGAALLAVEAALRSGVGFVTAGVPESVQPAFAARAPEALWLPWPETPSGALSLDGRILFDERAGRFTALLAGPGLSRDPETHALLRLVLQEHADLPVVLDADALVPELVALVAGRAAILTPHDGEWLRIAGHVPPDAVVVRKGPRTRVVGRGREVLVPGGGPVLARAGSGDVLAGLCVGRLAVHGDPFRAACEAAARHARAAEHVAASHGENAARTLDLVAALGVG